MLARSLPLLALCTAGALAAGCGLALDYDPPDPGDAGGASRDGGAGQDARIAPLDGAAGDGGERACRIDAQCQNESFCDGEERCQDGVCVAGSDPCPDPSPCMSTSCDEAADRCMDAAPPCPDDQVCDPRMGACVPPCTSDEDCSDENPCNGIEQCTGRICRLGTPPTCPPTDDQPCSVPTCDPVAGHCIEVPDDSLCEDSFPADCMFPMCTSAGCVLVPFDGACDDGLACTLDRCTPPLLTGNPATCEHTPSAEGGVCSDGVSCTDDRCEPSNPRRDAAGCVHTALDSLCSVGGGVPACGSLVCAGTDALVAYPDLGGCAPSLASDRCPAGTHCDPDPDGPMCLRLPDGCTDDRSCDDGNPCNGDEVCDRVRGCTRLTNGCPPPGPCGTSWCDLSGDGPACRVSIDPNCTSV